MQTSPRTAPVAAAARPLVSTLRLATADNGPLDRRSVVQLPTATLLAHLADLTASGAPVEVALASGATVTGRLGFAQLDRLVLPFWAPRSVMLPDLGTGQATLNYRCAGLSLSLTTQVRARWRGSLWMISLPASVAVPQVRLSQRTALPGWFFDFHASEQRGANLTRVVDLSTTGVRVRTRDRNLDLRPGRVLMGSLVGPRGATSDVPLRARVQRVEDDGREIDLACRFDHAGYKNLVRIANLLRVARGRIRPSALPDTPDS